MGSGPPSIKWFQVEVEKGNAKNLCLGLVESLFMVNHGWVKITIINKRKYTEPLKYTVFSHLVELNKKNESNNNGLAEKIIYFV